MDEYEVRSWAGWFRRVTPSLWTLAELAVIPQRGRRGAAKKN